VKSTLGSSSGKLVGRQETVGWEPSCSCHGQDGDGPGSDCADEDNWMTSPCVVLDPFCGAGTTGIVAVNNGQNFIGIDLNPGYVAVATARIQQAKRNKE